MNANERRPPGLCKINLITGHAIEYTIPVMNYINSIEIDYYFSFRQCVVNNQLYFIIIKQ
jgi:hypothetical protein